jgi:hypothetical protein
VSTDDAAQAPQDLHGTDSTESADPVEHAADETLDERLDEPGQTGPTSEVAGSEGSTF